jgi:hypothetical protein
LSSFNKIQRKSAEQNDGCKQYVFHQHPIKRQNGEEKDHHDQANQENDIIYGQLILFHITHPVKP